jgi:hypothetical protein
MLRLLNPIAPLLAELKRRHQNMFPTHTWLYRSDEDRICSVCDRQEYFDFGGGAAGSEWTLLQPGRRRAHFIPKPTAASAPSRPVVAVPEAAIVD